MLNNKILSNEVKECLRKVEIDEIELCLNLLKLEHPEKVDNKTYFQIANSIQKLFNIICTEQDILLIHEPTIDEMEESLRIHFESMGLYC